MMARSTFPAWVTDDSVIPDPFGYGERAVEFLRRLRHPASTAPGRAFTLAPFQERIVRRIYGPRHPDGRRIVKNVFLMLPRGNRKTSLAAGLALLHTIGPEKVRGGQAFFAAADRDQAGIAFAEAAGIVREDPRVAREVKLHDAFNAPKAIAYPRTGNTLRVLSSDGRKAHGLTPQFSLVDEIHCWPSRDPWEALRSGAAKVDGNLTIVATTAGRGDGTLAAELFDYARRVALGEIENEEFLPILFQAEAGDDWRDEAVWAKANPGLPYGFPSLAGMRALAKEAEGRPMDKAAFLQFNLNVWQANSRDPLFDLGTYDALAAPVDLSELEGLPCWFGLDMSLSGDLTALVGAWRHGDGRITVHPWLYVPGEGLEWREDHEGVPYRAWAADGLVHVIPGPVIDRTVIEDTVMELAARFDVKEVAVDPHLARLTMQVLHDEGVPVVEFRQAPLTMGVAAGQLEGAVNGGVLRHDGHPALRRHFANVVASRSDSGLTRMHKGRKQDRIDGAVAAAMAVSRALAGESRRSAYCDPETELFVF